MAREVAHDHDVNGLTYGELVRVLLVRGEAALWYEEGAHDLVCRHGVDRQRPGLEARLELVEASLQLVLDLLATLRGRRVFCDVGQGRVLHCGLQSACDLATEILVPGPKAWIK